ncbi:MAG: Bax inhibitor-1/YccA family protein [Pseudomonadota bacterium]
MADPQTMRATAGVRTAAIDEGLKAHMTKVYGTMSAGIFITALAAWAISGLATTTDPSAAAGQFGNGTYLTGLGAAIYASPLRWVLMFAPLIFVFGFAASINRMSAATAQTVFYAFAAVMGVSISSIMLLFTGESIVTTFLVTSIAFASLSLYGYTTKRDLGPIGAFLMIGLIGVVLASIINIFLGSSGLQFAISVIGVLVFAGLTAYDTQRMKVEYLQYANAGQTEWLEKSAIMGALSLYLNFINMFLLLLQLFGNRE